MRFISRFRSSLSQAGPLLATASAVAWLGIAGAPSAFAGPVTEAEANGTAVNNTITTAQSVLFTSFTPNADPNVFGTLPTASISGFGSGGDVDFFSFVTDAGTGYFDIDGGGFDAVLSLFDSNGTLLAYSDDNASDPGSPSGLDSFIGTYTFTQSGTYYIAVTQYSNFATQVDNSNRVVTNLIRPDGNLGGYDISGVTAGDSSFRFGSNGTQGGAAYTLHLSLSNPTGISAVPEPGEWATMGMAGAGLCGLMVRARRKKANTGATLAA